MRSRRVSISAVATFGWETLAPHESRRQLRSSDGQYSLAAKVRTGGPTAGYLYLDLHDEDSGWTILVLDRERREVARGMGTLKKDAWAECEQRLQKQGLLR
jgi:hypothetical protein